MFESQFSDDEIAAVYNKGADLLDQGNVQDATKLFRLLALVAPADQGVWEALAKCHELEGEQTIADALLVVSENIQALQSQEALPWHLFRMLFPVLFTIPKSLKPL